MQKLGSGKYHRGMWDYSIAVHKEVDVYRICDQFLKHCPVRSVVANKLLSVLDFKASVLGGLGKIGPHARMGTNKAE